MTDLADAPARTRRPAASTPPVRTTAPRRRPEATGRDIRPAAPELAPVERPRPSPGARRIPATRPAPARTPAPTRPPVTVTGPREEVMAGNETDTSTSTSTETDTSTGAGTALSSLDPAAAAPARAVAGAFAALRQQADNVGQRGARTISVLRGVPNIGTIFGVGLAFVGIVMLVIAWVRTARLTDVALQIPYVIAAGFTGLGLVVAGLTAVNLAAKHTEAAERRRQSAELRGLLSELRTALTDHAPSDPADDDVAVTGRGRS